jgi:hypothetical protein
LTYRYVLKYSKAKNEKVSVEAWPRSRKLALPHELRRPSFVIGSLKGGRVVMVRSYIRELASKYGSRRTRTGFRVDFPPESMEAIVDAYRVGLTVATLSYAETDELAEKVMRYVMSCMPEEVWFWTSKFLGVVREEADRSRVINALCVIGEAKPL